MDIDNAGVSLLTGEAFLNTRRYPPPGKEAFPARNLAGGAAVTSVNQHDELPDTIFSVKRDCGCSSAEAKRIYALSELLR